MVGGVRLVAGGRRANGGCGDRGRPNGEDGLQREGVTEKERAYGGGNGSANGYWSKEEQGGAAGRSQEQK